MTGTAKRICGWTALLLFALAGIGCGGGNSTSSVASGVPPTPAPQIMLSRISPSRVTVGVPIGILILSGQNFTSGSMALLDGVVINSVVRSSTEIDATLDTSLTLTAANHTVQVQDGHGNSPVLTFSVYQPSAGPQEFLAQASTYVGFETGPSSAVLADFNGDGLDDLVLGAISDQTLYILYGQANGSFSSGKSIAFTASGQIEGLAAGDVNGDGHPDLVVLTMDSGNTITRVTTLLNDGKGNFQPSTSTTFPTLSIAQPVLADFRGVGRLDLVVGSSSASGELLLFPGNGDGSFDVPVGLGLAGLNCIKVEVADFNNDGLPDLVYQGVTQTANQVRILLNRGNSVFVDTQPPALAGVIGPFAVADFNNDHKADLVLFQGPAPSSSAVVMFGQGDGTFLPGPSFSMASIGNPTLLIAGDLDGDGNVDLVTNTGVNGPDQTAVFWGDGTGNFSLQWVTAESSHHPLIGDINGDGIPDLVQPAPFYFAGVTLGRRDRRLLSPAVVLPDAPSSLSAGDVLGDGFQSLLVSGNIINSVEFPGAIYHIQADGSFKKIGSTPPTVGVLADLDGDGIADLIGFLGDNLAVWKGDGTGDYSSLTPIFEFPLNGITNTDIVIRDMDHDGIPDIVISGTILYGQGGMKFTPVILPAGINEGFAIGDFDGDGNLNVATSIGIMFGMGNRAFTALTGSVPAFTQDPYRANWVVADVNGDGKDDLVFADGSFIEIALGTGRAGIVIDQVLDDGDIVGFLGIADFNGDGRLDIVSTTLFAEDAVLFTNDGKGAYLVSACGIGAQTYYGLVADLNRDGKPDLAIFNFPLDFRPFNVVIALHQ